MEDKITAGDRIGYALPTYDLQETWSAKKMYKDD